MIAFLLTVKLSTTIFWFANYALMRCHPTIVNIEPKQPTEGHMVEVELEYTFESQLFCINAALAEGKTKADQRQATERR